MQADWLAGSQESLRALVSALAVPLSGLGTSGSLGGVAGKGNPEGSKTEAAEEIGGLPEVHAAAALINALTGVQASPANVSDEGVLEPPVCAIGALLPGAPADDPISIRERRTPWLEVRSLDAAADPLALFRARFRAVTENVWYSQGQEFGLRGAPAWGVEGPLTNDVHGRVDGVASRSGIWSPLARASGARSPLA
jgi:hypothetical protein